VTPRSDLAFGFNSATLSAEAKTAIDAAELTGDVLVG
jgi:hypothetical protein